MDEEEITRVLLLSANPKDTNQLRLNEEFREIREGLNLSENRALFDIKQGGATRAKDLRRLIFSFNPHIVHFSGHSSTDGIYLESDTGRYNPVTGYALANLFSLFSDTVKCVILNACYSREQAFEIVQQIPYVVGMSTRIRDDSAIQFAIGFYDAIGAGRGIEDAYKFGCNAIQLEGGNNLGGSDRSLILPISETGALEKYSDIDEADKPVLLTRVREVKASSANDEKETPVDSTHPAVSDKNDTAAPVPPSPTAAVMPIDSSEPSKNWLPWVLASLIPLMALGFVFWDTQMNTQQSMEQKDSVEQHSVKPDANANLGTEALMKEEQELAQKQDALRRQAEAQQQAQIEKEKRLQAEAEKQEAKLHQQAETEEQTQIKESLRQQRIREAKNKLREKAIAKKEHLLKKAELAQRKAQIKAAAAKQERIQRQQAEFARMSRQKQAEQERRQWEDQQRTEAERKAWQAKQDEIARQQSERKRWEELQRQKAAAQAETKKAQQSTQPEQKESEGDRILREVGDLIFDNR